MRIALVADVDIFAARGLPRPKQLPPYLHTPGMVALNLLRGFREAGVQDIHLVTVSIDVARPFVEEGPLGIVHGLPCPKFSGASSFFLWRRAITLRELRAIRPDIVHGQGTEREHAFVAATSPYPHVVTFHGIINRVYGRFNPLPLFSLSHVQLWTERLVVRRAKEVICISREVDDFLREGGSTARRHFIRNPLSPVFLETRLAPHGSKEFVLLFVGTIYPLKGLRHLVEALALLRGRVDRPVRLRVIGTAAIAHRGSWYEAEVRQRANELGVAGQIDWLGSQPATAVAREMAAADALVLPSFQETAPTCVAEAMAVGLPVVATRVGGIPDFVADGVTGLLAAPGDSEDLAAAIGRLLSDAALRQRMAAAARADVLTRQSPTAVAQQTAQVYRTILAGDGSGH